MLANPVLTYELKSIARQSRFYILRFGCGLFLLYLTVVFFGGLESRGSHRPPTLDELSGVGRSLFGLTLTVQLVTAVGLTPALAAGAIAEDRRRKILSYLLASPLSNGEIVLGKLLARLAHLTALVLVGLPILSLALLFGGVDPLLLVLAELNVLAVVFFLGSLSIFLSSRFQKPRDAVVCAYVCVFCWLMLPGFSEFFAAKLVPQRPELLLPISQALAIVADSTPFGAAAAVAAEDRPQTIRGDALWSVGLNLALGAAFLIPTIRGLRRREQTEGGAGARSAGGFLGRGGDWVLGRGRGRGAPRARPFDLDRPMIWKECPGRRLFAERELRVLAAVVKLAAAGLSAFWLWSSAEPAFFEVLEHGYGGSHTAWDDRTAFNFGLRFATVGGYYLLILILAAAAAGAVASEKERDSWISLLATPLDGSEILLGKIAGAFWSARFVFAGLLILWTAGLAAGGLHPFGFALLIVATAVYSVFATALGIHYSNICRTSTRALIATIATLIVLNGGYMMCCIPVFFRLESDSPSLALSLAGMTPVVEAFAACSYPDVESFFHGGAGAPRGPEPSLAVFTYVSSVGGYGAAAFSLLARRFAAFDDDAGRPRRRRPPV